MTLHLRFVLLGVACAALTACPNPRAVCGNAIVETGEACDDGNTNDGDGCEADCLNLTPTGGGEGGGTGGGVTGGGTGGGVTGGGTGGGVTGGGTGGGGPILPACTVTPGTAFKLITGDILTDTQILTGGQLLIDASGLIACVAADCSAETGASGATTIACPGQVVSPALINAHDHLTYQNPPYVPATAVEDERFEHRHNWRRGQAGHTGVQGLALGVPEPTNGDRFAEVRQVMAGTTSVVTHGTWSTQLNGLLRNLDTSPTQGQLGTITGSRGVVSETFPCGDSGGTLITSPTSCPATIDDGTAVPADSAYFGHVAEGINEAARNEFLCLAAKTNSVIGPKSAFVHGIALTPQDLSLMATAGTSLVWSPRSNVSLYGDTALIPVARRSNVNLALGTDWLISGSMNLLRELRCADELNSGYLGNALTDEDLWRTVTANGADALQASSKLGRLRVGLIADVAIFAPKAGKSAYRAVIEAEPQDVLMTMRGGSVLYGEAALVAAFDAANECEAIDVCGAARKLCLVPDTKNYPAVTGGMTLADLNTSSQYPLFFCGTTPVRDEPTCVPERSAMWGNGQTNSVNSSSIYTSASTDMDHDGIANGTDNCPGVFNPIRPMHNGTQADFDGDGLGEVCDPCPLDANTTTCTVVDPNDRDGDGVPTLTDNCPLNANTDQADQDTDGKGDVCDACPTAANPGSAGCPTTIYAIKTGASPVGQTVALNDVLVTAVGSTGYFLQVAPTDTGYDGGDYSGIFAYAPGSGVAPGDRLNIPAASPSNYFGQIQLTGALSAADGGVSIASSGNPLPPPAVVLPAEVATDGGRATALEGVLIRVENVTVTDLAPVPGAADPAPTNEFVIDGSLRVNDYLFLISPFPTLNQSYLALEGVLDYRNGNSKLEPRFAADVIYGPPTLLSLSPSLTFVREDAGVTFPAPLLARLTNGAFGDTAITVTSSGPELQVGDGGLIIVPDGGLFAEVPLLGVSSTDGGTVTVTATYGADSRTAQVRVLGSNDVPRLLSVSPGMATVTAGATQSFTATLDMPVATATDLTVALVPNTLGTAPMTVTVQPDAMSVTFVASVDAMATGTGTLTVSYGGDVASANITVRPVNTVTHLVINEVDYDNTGTDTAEFIEIFNGTGGPIDLAGYTVVLINGATAAGASYATIALGSAGTLANGEYLVIGAPGTLVGLPATVKTVAVTTPPDNLIQNGPDGLILYDSAGGVVDALSYEGATNYQGSPVQEGTAATTALADTSLANSPSICRIPNGEDTDVNAVDFSVCAAPTKGTVNAP